MMDADDTQAENERLRAEVARLRANVPPRYRTARKTMGELLEQYIKFQPAYFSVLTADTRDIDGNDLRPDGYSIEQSHDAEAAYPVPVCIRIAQGTDQATALRFIDKLREIVASDEGADFLSFEVTKEGDDHAFPF